MPNIKRYIFTVLLSVISNYVLFITLIGFAGMSGGESSSPNIILIIAIANLIITASLAIIYKLFNRDLSIWVLIITFIAPYLIIWTNIFNQIKYTKIMDEKAAVQIQKDKSYIVSISNFSNASASLSKRASTSLFYISLPVNFSDKFTDQQISNTLKFDIKFMNSSACNFKNIPFRVNRWEPYDNVISNPAGKYVFKYDYSSPFLDDNCINAIKNNKNDMIMQITELNPIGDGKNVILKELLIDVEIK